MEAKKELVSVNNIQDKVYVIRGQQVMLDFDLAEIYGYEVRSLNQQVKRNIDRFPDDFMFQLNRDEMDLVKSQIVISQNSNFFEGKDGGRRTLPYAFTEQGIYMLATVLRGELARQQSIFIMRTFREMRHYIKQNEQFVSQSEMRLVSAKMTEMTVQIVGMSDRQALAEKEIRDIQNSINTINENFITDKDYKEFVIYKGEKFEADMAYVEIYGQAKHSIYVVDNYVNTKTLQLLSQKKDGVEVILFTENGHGRKGFLTSAVVNDFEKQYPHLCIKPNPDCHDRLIVLDYNQPTEQVFHCGASSKDAGKKLCAINKLENNLIIHSVIDDLLLGEDKTI